MSVAGVYWQGHRRIIQPSFHSSVLNSFVDVFAESSEVLIEMLSKEVGQLPFNIMHYIHPCSMDLVCGE